MQQNVISRLPLQNLNGAYSNDNNNNNNNINNNNKNNNINNNNSMNFNDFYASVQNENFNPSQQHSLNKISTIKSDINNDLNALNNSNNLYVRRVNKSTANTCINNNNNNNKVNPLGAPLLRIDVSSCSNYSVGLSMQSSVGLSSSLSINTNYDNILSSASSIKSLQRQQSINNTYKPQISANDDNNSDNDNDNDNDIVNNDLNVNHFNKKPKKNKKNKSLFQKLTNLVTNRGNKQSKRKNDEKDEDGDSQIADFSKLNDDNANNDCIQQNVDLKLNDHQNIQPVHDNNDDDDDDEEEEQDIFTPLTGNTPRLITSTTPQCTQYNEDIITSILGRNTFYSDYLIELFAEESSHSSLIWYNNISSYLNNNIRIAHIEWICNTGIDYKISRNTIYRAIYYFDKLCSSQEINLNHLRIIAATSLLIAIKWNEKEEKVPSLNMLSKSCFHKYSSSQFKPMEIKILNLLNFKLKIILPIDFILYYINSGCIYNDDILDGHKNLHLHNQSKIYLEKFSIFFLDLIVQNYEFYKFKPSIIAAAVIIASRRALKIKPYFNQKLIKLTNYYPQQINECCNTLWNIYRNKFTKDAQKAEIIQNKPLLQHYNYYYKINNKPVSNSNK